MLSSFVDFEVLPNVMFSDHSPISACIGIDFYSKEDKRNISCNEKMVWDTEKKNAYIAALNSPEVLSNFEDMMNIINEPILGNDSVERTVGACVSAIRTATDPLFLRKAKHRDGQAPCPDANHSGPPWADCEWRQSKKDFFRKRDKYSKSQSEHNRVNMVNARSYYKRLSNRNIKNYQNSQTKRLIQARFNNVKLYWKLLDNKQQPASSKIDVADFYSYFLTLSDPHSQLTVLSQT